MAESSKMTMKLLIISKSQYGPPGWSAGDPRWCYLGMDRNSGKIYRPIPWLLLGPSNERDFFWQFHLHVGETHEFEISPFQDQSMIPFPHRNDDIQVTYKRHVKKDGVVGMADMFQILSPHARETIEGALGLQGGMKTSDTGRQFVDEHTDCHSFGIIRCMRQVAHQNTTVQHEFLVIMELARPLFGYMEFNPRRCFQKEVGRVSNSEITQ